MHYFLRNVKVLKSSTTQEEENYHPFNFWLKLNSSYELPKISLTLCGEDIQI